GLIMAAERTPAREITPEHLYWSRRSFLKAGAAAASVLATGWVYRRLNRTGAMPLTTEQLSEFTPASPDSLAQGFTVKEARTLLEQVVNYNNFYEFTTDKEGVSAAAAGFAAKPWQVRVGGMVHKPRVFDIDDITSIAPLEERIYRMRCVEAWSMVI